MVSQRSRSSRTRGKRKNKKTALWGIIPLILLLALAAFLFINRSWLFTGTNKATAPSTNQTSSSTKEVSSSSEVSSKSADTITWEKQDTPVKVPILMYHAIHEMAPEEAGNANLIVAPTIFESHLKALKEAGYYTLTPEEAYKVLTENVLPKGKKVVWLTFDDSLWDFYSIAYPLLKQYDMKATNNVITGFTDTKPDHLTLEQIKEMQSNGMSFQSHTVNHPDLEYSTIDAQSMELKDSKTYLDSNLHQDTIAIAYPAGRYSTDTISTVEATGYKLGVTTNEGLASAADGLLTLNRVRILPGTSAESLLQTISQ